MSTTLLARYEQTQIPEDRLEDDDSKSKNGEHIGRVTTYEQLRILKLTVTEGSEGPLV